MTARTKRRCQAPPPDLDLRPAAYGHRRERRVLIAFDDDELEALQRYAAAIGGRPATVARALVLRALHDREGGS